MVFGASAALRLIARGLNFLATIVDSFADAALSLGDPAVGAPGSIVIFILICRGKFFEAVLVFAALSLYEVVSRGNTAFSASFAFEGK